MFKYILFLLLILPFTLQAQLTETFSDEDFTNNPAWNGSLSKYIISTSTAIPASIRPGIQTSSTVADTTYLSTPIPFSVNDSIEWSFWWKISFNPSTGNYARYYLMSDQANLKASLNGYYLCTGFGGNDRLTLVRQDGNTSAVVLTGNVANLNRTTNESRIKVVYKTGGIWKLYCDTLGGTAFCPEGTATDNTYSNFAYTGIYNLFSVSNATKFYFDDLYIGSVQVDTIRPTVSSLKASSIFTLDLLFSEAVSDATALDLSSYSVDHGIGIPSSVSKDAVNPLKYILTFTQPFPDGILCNLSINQISDNSGNVILPASLPFAYYIAKAYDLSINEIMADPSPAVGLPQWEYIELYNRTSLPINLEGWMLKIGSTSKLFGNVSIPPASYLILSDDDAKSDFENFGQFYGFQSFSVSNTGAMIQLISSVGNIISYADFSDEWYQDANKDDGGYSVEQIDPANPCGGISNWKASLNLFGGTPGVANSVKSNNPDIQAPEIYRAVLQDSTTLLLWFSEAVDSTEAINPYSYSFDHGLSIVGMPKGNSPQYNQVVLKFSPATQVGVIYNLIFSDTIFDCAANPIVMPQSVRFARTEIPQPGDLVINEILSNPFESGNDYVEIYNRSSKILDLRFAQLATLNDSLLIDDQVMIAPQGFPVFPGEYWVLAENKSKVTAFYQTLNPGNFVEMSDFPAFNNDSGKVLLVLTDNTIIDRVDYTVTWHDPILKSTDGVSFERVNPERSSADAGNWHSAASTVGFGTPTYKNSQYSDAEAVTEVTVDPQVFSPDNDGFQDVVNIVYEFDNPGFICNIRIFDIEGKPVRDLVSNELLGSSGIFSWDGKDKDGNRVSTGYYVVYTEVFNAASGEVKKFKNAVAVAARTK